MNKRIRLPLSVSNDADLLSIRSIEDFDFKAWIKDALRSYAKDRETMKYPLPVAPVKTNLKNVMLSITLHERRDAATIEWLGKLAEGKCAGVIKTVLRCSLDNPCLIAYYNDPADAFSTMRLAEENVSTSIILETASAGNQNTASIVPSSQPVPVKQEPELPDDFNIFTWEPVYRA